MKFKNVNFNAWAEFSNGTMKFRQFVTENALSNWANRQYRLDNDVVVRVTKGLYPNDVFYCTYHA